MTVLPITQIGDPVLRIRTPELSVEELRSAEVQRLIDDLIETRAAAGGAGLAAPQVGASLRIAVCEVDAATRYTYKPPIPRTVIVNPVIEPIAAETAQINEGCLSVPGLRGELPRFMHVRVRYLDRHGNPHEEVKRGLTAGTFQHETDHLNGILFVDRVTDPTTFMTWESFERFHRDAFLARVAELPT